MMTVLEWVAVLIAIVVSFPILTVAAALLGTWLGEATWNRWPNAIDALLSVTFDPMERVYNALTDRLGL